MNVRAATAFALLATAGGCASATPSPPPAPGDDAPAAAARESPLGCYVVAVGAWSRPVPREVPDTIRLLATTAYGPAGRVVGRAIEPAAILPGTGMDLSYWATTDGDSLRLVWGNGYEVISVQAGWRDGVLSGTALFYTDERRLGVPDPTAPFEARRVVCPDAGISERAEVLRALLLAVSDRLSWMPEREIWLDPRPMPVTIAEWSRPLGERIEPPPPPLTAEEIAAATAEVPRVRVLYDPMDRPVTDVLFEMSEPAVQGDSAMVQVVLRWIPGGERDWDAGGTYAYLLARDEGGGWGVVEREVLGQF